MEFVVFAIVLAGSAAAKWIVDQAQERYRYQEAVLRRMIQYRDPKDGLSG